MSLPSCCVLNKTHISATFGTATGANIRMILNGKHRELSRACSESKWPLLRCRECPLHHLAFLCCALFSSLLFFTVHFSSLCTGQTALLCKTALHQQFCSARHYILVFCASAHHYSSLDCTFAKDQSALHWIVAWTAAKQTQWTCSVKWKGASTGRAGYLRGQAWGCNVVSNSSSLHYIALR